MPYVLVLKIRFFSKNFTLKKLTLKWLRCLGFLSYFFNVRSLFYILRFMKTIKLR